jgi:aryl-alcohol dehydrogenase-like predicted oxidoreductase
VFNQSSNILLTPGTKSVEHLRENLGAADIELAAAEFKALAG